MTGSAHGTGLANRPHLASLVSDWLRLDHETAVVAYRGNRTVRTSYKELATLTGRFAAELERRGIGYGERVVLWGENSAEWVAVFFGCMLRGVLAVPLDAAGSAQFGSRVLAEVSPRLVIGDQQRLESLITDTPTLTFDELVSVLPADPDFEPSAEVTEQTPFQIVFTSGTTSEPKGVVHTHRNVLVSLAPIESEIHPYRRYERPFHPLRFLHTLPLSHVFGQFMGLWIPTVLGAELHLVSALDPAKLIALTKRERISVLIAVPRVLEILRAHLTAKHPDLLGELAQSQGIPAWKRWWRFRSLHRQFGFKFWALICGGATLPPELESFWNGLGFALVQGYGMTETAALVTLNHPFKVGKGTLGKALPGREVRLGPEGEILVRGDMLAAGTWRNGTYQPRKSDWLATGDLATQDATGELRFAGRKGDVIVTAAGLNIHPQDIERILLAQPEVRAAAVVACDLPTGPEPVAVVLSREPSLDLRKVQQAANAQLATFQQLRFVLRWPDREFPYTSTGKLLRREIAAWASAQVAGVRATSGSLAPDRLLQLIAEVTRSPALDATGASLLTEDLHLDSLGRVQLQSLLSERIGVEISDDQMAALQTLGELRVFTGSTPEPASTASVDPRPALATSGFQPTISLPYARWPWSAPVQALRSVFLELIAIPLVRLLAKPRAEFAAPLRLSGPVLLVANHVNTYDVPLLLSALPGPLRRRITPAMSAEVLSKLRHGQGQGNWLLNLLARPAYWLIVALFNVFPLPRSSGLRASFAHAGQALDRGFSVLVFPEGSRSYTGTLRPFRPGIGLLVQSSGVPVLPVALQGMGTEARSGSRWFRSGRVVVRVGPPISFPPGTPPDEITRQLEEAMRALQPS